MSSQPRYRRESHQKPTSISVQHDIRCNQTGRGIPNQLLRFARDELQQAIARPRQNFLFPQLSVLLGCLGDDFVGFGYGTDEGWGEIARVSGEEEVD